MRSWICITTAIAAAMLCLPLGGCASSVWRVYDACAAQTSGFVAMVECGKAKREASCRDDFLNPCSSIGNAFVQYADALAAQVQSHQITEADAMARFADYKSRVIQNQERNDAIAASAVPKSIPRAKAPAHHRGFCIAR